LEKGLDDLKKSRIPLDKKKAKATQGWKIAKDALRGENVSEGALIPS